MSRRSLFAVGILGTLLFIGCAPSAMVTGKNGTQRVIDRVTTKEKKAILFRSDTGKRSLNFKKISKITLLSDSTSVIAGETWMKAIIDDKKAKFGAISDTGWIKVDQELLGVNAQGDYYVYLKDLQEIDFNYKKSAKASGGSEEAAPTN